MTTDMRYEFIDNISTKNNVLSIAASPSLRLSASVWSESVNGVIMGSRFDCLNYVIGRLCQNWPEWRLWLIAGQKAVQPDNRITRHNGFWKSLQKAGLVLPTGVFISESVIGMEGGIRAFGAICFDSSQINKIHSILRVTQGAIILMSEALDKSTIHLLVCQGWPSRNTKPPEEILEAVCNKSALVVDVFGDFDDPEVSVAVIGKKEVLHDLQP